MIYGEIADRYAQAIYELGVETNQLTQLADQIRKAAETYASSTDLRGVLDNPLIAPDQRDAILKSVASRLGLGPMALNTLRLLVQRQRLPALPEIAERLGVLSDERAGVLRAEVISAAPLGESYFQKLKGELEAATGRKVIIQRSQDPSLIAGVITRIGDNTIDGSLKGRLAELERRLIAS